MTSTPIAGPEADSDGRSVPPRLLELLRCAVCGETVAEASPGLLRCSRCHGEYPVWNGVPRMLAHDIPPQVAETAEAFGWQWKAFDEQLPQFREEFLEWLNPVTPSDLRGRKVMDAGCGKGRHILFAGEYGAEQAIGLDLSEAVDVARRATAHLPNVDVVQGDLLNPPIADGSLDVIYSIGVIHHTPRPSQAIKSLASRLRSGGTLHVWVYGYEGNVPVRLFVDPLRRLLARHVPRHAVRVGSLPPSLVLTALTRVYPHLDRVPCLPYREYFTRLGAYSVRHIWGIVYDQLMAPTTHYIKRGELEAWFRDAGLVDIRIRDSRGMSWTGTGRRP